MARTATLWFESSSALRAALRLVPPKHMGAGGTVASRSDGSLTVMSTLPVAVKRALVEAGAKAVDPVEGRPFVHWAELVPLDADPEPDLREVLFVLPSGAPWLPLAGELVRLGCDRVDIARLDHDDWILRARRPPFYTVAKAAADAWRVYSRQGPIWVEVGHQHALADRFEVADDTIGLLGRDGWRTVAVKTWTDLAERLDLALEPSVTVEQSPPGERLVVRLRLKPAPRAAAPILWSVPDPVDETLDRLLAMLPQAVVDRLLLARYRGEDGSEGALIRARPGTVPPTLEGLTPFIAHPQLPSVHVPAGKTVDPPLRAKTLAELLDPGIGTLAWLHPTETSFVVHRIAEDAFQPLSDWVVYLADRDQEEVEAWMGSALFDWEPLDLPIHRDKVERTRKEKEPTPQPTSRRTRNVPAPEPEPEPEPVPEQPALIEVPEPAAMPTASEAERQLQALQGLWEQNPDRDDLWEPMAALHHSLDQHREAALCWTRAMWDKPTKRKEIAARWAQRVPGTGELVDDPDPTQLSAMVAHLLAEDVTHDPPALQRWLDAHDRPMDVRSRWLARRRAAVLAGGDALALARGRDEVLSSIRGGLARWRDVPAFLRTSTSPEDRRWLGSSLAELPGRLEPMIPDSAPKDCTRAYARLTIAWAEACLGLDGPVQQALAAAERALPKKDPVHQVLLGLYRSGIEESLAGLPPETPPPPEVTAALERLEKFERYKVQRLQDQSLGVLAEAGATDAFTNWVRKEKKKSLAILPPDELQPAIRKLLDGLDKEHPSSDLLEVLNASLALEEAPSAALLEEVIATAQGLAPAERVPVLVEAAAIAAALQRPTAIEGAPIDALQNGLLGLMRHDPNAVVEPSRDLARSLVRCGLTGRAEEMFTALREACPTDASVVRLRMSGAIAQAGGEVGDEANDALNLLTQDLKTSDRIALVAAIADLATPLPVERAVALWTALVPQAAIPDTFSTSTHFARSFLQVTEILAAAHVHPDRLLGAEGRARIDADEYRVRQRIHREERL